MRVLLLTHYFSTHGGGVEIVAAQVARRLNVADRIEVAWLAADVDPVPKELAANCLPLPAWNPLESRAGLPYPLLKPRAVFRLWREIRHADLVHIHECQYMHSMLGAVFCLLRGKRYVVTQHVGEVEYRSRLKRLALRLLNELGAKVVLDRASAVLFVSAHVLQFFSSLMRTTERARVVQNGVDADLFQPGGPGARTEARELLDIVSDRPVVAFAGRFVEKKGLHILESLARARPDVTFILAGRGPIDPHRWGLQNVRVAGVLDASQLVALYRAADLLCLPSFGEGFPLVVQEAMACGCPTLIDKVVLAGARLPDDLGFVLDACAPDAAEQALSALNACLAERPAEQEARRMRNAAYARTHWTWSRCVEAHRSALEGAFARSD